MSEWHQTSCGLCAQNCGLEVLVEDNKLVKVRPNDAGEVVVGDALRYLDPALPVVAGLVEEGTIVVELVAGSRQVRGGRVVRRGLDQRWFMTR